MYKYAQEGKTDTVIRVADGKVIKMELSDPLFKAVELWMSRGNKPMPPDPVEVIEPVKEDEKDETITHEKLNKKNRKWRELRERE